MAVAKSPFPGMDPYLEPYWLSVHNTLATHIADNLNPRLPVELRADTARRLESEYVEVGRPAQALLPDAYVYRPRDVADVPDADGGVAVLADPAIAEPADVPLELEVEEDAPNPVRFVEIRDDAADGRLVTAIEILSPSNKLPGEDRTAYLRKRSDYLASGASVVEVDLHRRGRPTWTLAAAAATPYRVTVRRPWRPKLELYPVRLTDRLPAVRVPLRHGEPDILLHLQPLLDGIYANRRYRVDYSRPCDPPLAGDDLAWWERRRAEWATANS